ncbi:MAG: sterol desaturase family protein [Acidimicrobiales bacterium]
MDLTVAAIPAFFGTMGLEYAYLKRKAERDGPSAGDYERFDTVTSLTMGVGSLLAPIAMGKLLAPITPGTGRYAKVLLGVAAGSVAVTTVADHLGRLDQVDEDPMLPAPGTAGAGSPDPATPDPAAAGVPAPGEVRGPWPTPSPVPPTAGPADARTRRRTRVARAARKVAEVGGVASIVSGGVAATTAIASLTTGNRLWKRRILPDLGTGPAALAAAVLGWDFIYYWNHRFMHSSRFLWAIHVVHHSSERYNLSTALRQPVADAFGVFVPYGALALLGIRPSLILQARGINLIYQYWIHTETVDRLGPLESVLNTASHHRVHHGSNRRYLDRNHGSILIIWDRLFGSFTPEDPDEPVVYGLTKNIETFNPLRVATHEHADMLDDVRRSTTWRDRLSYVLRGPGWAYARRAERATAAVPVAA